MEFIKEINEILNKIDMKIEEAANNQEMMILLKEKIERDKNEKVTEEKRERMMMWYVLSRLWRIKWLGEKEDEMPIEVKNNMTVLYNFHSDSIAFEEPSSVYEIKEVKHEEIYERIATKISPKYKIIQSFDKKKARDEFEKEFKIKVNEYTKKIYNEKRLEQIREDLIRTIKKYT